MSPCPTVGPGEAGEEGDVAGAEAGEGEGGGGVPLVDGGAGERAGVEAAPEEEVGGHHLNGEGVDHVSALLWAGEAGRGRMSGGAEHYAN